MTFKWTVENAAEAERLYRGGVSAAKVAILIGAKTRNQIIGKMHRMHVYGRREPSAPKNAAPRREPRVRHSAIHLGPPIVHEPGPSGGITIMELRVSSCRWPIGGTGVEIKFCGSKCDGPYCRKHAKVAYEPMTDAQKRSQMRGMMWVAKR